MLTNFDTVSADAMSLPPDLRFVLARRLLESVEDAAEGDEELFAEIERRCAEVDSGAVQPIPFEQAMSEIRANLNATRNSTTSPT
jgi:putative addiction module component (TIGR02574 family)